MIEAIDRLSDDFWTEEELHQMDLLVIEHDKFDGKAKHLCWYHLLKHGEYTGKAMLLAVESIVDGQEAVNRAVAEIGLTAAIGEYGEESVLNNLVIDSAYLLLHKYKYKSHSQFTGSDKVYNYEEWMAKLC